MTDPAHCLGELRSVALIAVSVAAAAFEELLAALLLERTAAACELAEQVRREARRDD